MKNVERGVLYIFIGFLSVSLARQVAAQATLENPQPGSFQSGIGLISGWSCSSGVIVVIDGQSILPAYGTGRLDAAPVCGGNSNVGFGLLLNYNLLGSGTHTAQLKVNGAAVGSPAAFTVTVPVGEFATGLAKTVPVTDFPSTGQTTTLVWQQSQQNFAIAGVSNSTTSSSLTCTNGTLIPDGTNAGFGSLVRYQSDWQPQTAADSTSWRIFDGHAGGFGATLEYIGCANNQSSVWLQFGYDALFQVAVRDGWLGATDRGLRIGDSLSTVQRLYPEAVRQPTRFSMQPDYDVWVVEPAHPIPDQANAEFRIALKDGSVAMMHVTWENPTGTFGDVLTVQNIIGPYDRINVSGPISSQNGWDWTVQPVVAVQAQPTDLTIAVGQDATLWVYFFGEVECCSGQWTSSAPSVVRIDSVSGQYGYVHAVAPGESMITIRQSPTSPHTGHVRVFVTP
jgi:hypothetical protein